MKNTCLLLSYCKHIRKCFILQELLDYEVESDDEWEEEEPGESLSNSEVI